MNQTAPVPPSDSARFRSYPVRYSDGGPRQRVRADIWPLFSIQREHLRHRKYLHKRGRSRVQLLTRQTNHKFKRFTDATDTFCLFGGFRLRCFCGLFPSGPGGPHVQSALYVQDRRRSVGSSGGATGEILRPCWRQPGNFLNHQHRQLPILLRISDAPIRLRRLGVDSGAEWPGIWLR